VPPHDPSVDPLPGDLDPDLVPADRPGAQTGSQWPVVAMVAVGGVGGAEARYGLGLLLTHSPTQFAWSTLLINASGSLLLGLLVAILELRRPHRLLRPLLGAGVLGGYTTFSTFSVDAARLIRLHHVATAAAYVTSSVVVCALAVWIGSALGRRWGR
jgi:CrcB protein